MSTDDPSGPAQTGPKRVTSGGEFPSDKQVKGYGDLAFLFLRSKLHAKLTGPQLLSSIQPAIDSGQFAVMRQDHIPRACITWALLDARAEERFLAGHPLTAPEWYSGDRLWIVDIVAPYAQGTGGQMLTWFRDGLPEKHNTINALRPGRAGMARHFTATRMANGRWGSRVQARQLTD